MPAILIVMVMALVVSPIQDRETVESTREPREHLDSDMRSRRHTTPRMEEPPIRRITAKDPASGGFFHASKR